jgi:hypothetical protein
VFEFKYVIQNYFLIYKLLILTIQTINHFQLKLYELISFAYF